MNDSARTFGLWYDLRQKLPFEQKYEDFYAECPWIEEGERLGFTDMDLFAPEVAPRVREAVEV